MKEETVVNKEVKRGRRKGGARFIAEVSKDNNETINLLNGFLEKCNNKEHGRAVTWSDIVIYLISSNNNERVIRNIQSSVLTKEDRVMARLKELNKDSENELTIIDLAAKAFKL